MYLFNFRRPLNPTTISLATMTAAIAIALSSPALAVDGRTAVGQCIDKTATGARCAWNVNDKGEIDICDKSGCQFCASATSECTPARISVHHRPTNGLPAGTQVMTPVGWFTVSGARK
jgi:hypothetical protein